MMKSTILAIGAFALFASAQDNTLPECGQVCVSNMASSSKAEELGCSEGDIACICQNTDYINGLRDCSVATCGEGSEGALAAVQVGLQVCSNAGVVITDGPGNTPSATVTASGDAISVSTSFATITSDGSTITSAASTTTQVASPVVSTLTSSGSVITTTFSTITDSSASDKSNTGTATNSDDSTASDGSATSTESDDAAMPQRTFAPGLVAAAGVALFLI